MHGVNSPHVVLVPPHNHIQCTTGDERGSILFEVTE